MKNVTITIDGKEYTAQMSDEAVAEITVEKKRTGYERANIHKQYFFVDSTEYYTTESDSLTDQERYNDANYITDKQLYEDNKRADRLMRHLRQWQALNDEPVGIEFWREIATPKYFIYYNHDIDCLDAGSCYIRRLAGGMYFSSAAKAQEAIDVFHDELIWHFTQYRSRLDEPEVRDEVVD